MSESASHEAFQTHDRVGFALETARLRERVESHDKDIAQLTALVRQTFAELNSKFDAQLSLISAKLDERGKFPWPAAGFLLSAVVAIGALAYWPINAEQARLAKDIDVISAQLLSVNDHFNASIDKLNDRVVPRGEHEQKWRAYDIQLDNSNHRIEQVQAALKDVEINKVSVYEFNTQHSDLKASIAADVSYLQRQITDIRTETASTYNVRDEIIDQKKRLDDLEGDIRRAFSAAAQPNSK